MKIESINTVQPETSRMTLGVIARLENFFSFKSTIFRVMLATKVGFLIVFFSVLSVTMLSARYITPYSEQLAVGVIIVVNGALILGSGFIWFIAVLNIETDFAREYRRLRYKSVYGSDYKEKM